MLPPQDSLLSLTTVLARTQPTQVPEKPAVQDQKVATPDRPSFEDQLRTRRSTKPEPEARTRTERATPANEQPADRATELPQKPRPAVRATPERPHAEKPSQTAAGVNAAPTPTPAEPKTDTTPGDTRPKASVPAEATLPESNTAPVQQESNDQTATPIPLTFLQATATRYAEKPEKATQVKTNTEPVGEPHEVIAPAMFLQAMQPVENTRPVVTQVDKQTETVEIDSDADEEVVLAFGAVPSTPNEKQPEVNLDEDQIEVAPVAFTEADQTDASTEEPVEIANLQPVAVKTETGNVDAPIEPSPAAVVNQLPEQPVAKQPTAEVNKTAEATAAEPVEEASVEVPVDLEDSEIQPLQSTQKIRTPELAEAVPEEKPEGESEESPAQNSSVPQSTAAPTPVQAAAAPQNQPVAATDEAVPTTVTPAATTGVEPVVTAEGREQIKTSETTAGPRDSFSSPVSVESRPAAATGTKTESPRPVLDTTRGDVPQKLAGFIQQAAEQGKPLRIRLNPPELGTLQIEIGRHQGQVTARLEVESAATRAVIFEQLNLLRDSLQQQGLKLDQIQIEVNESLSQGSGGGVDGESGSGQFTDDEERQRHSGFAAGEPIEEEKSSRPAVVRDTTSVTEIDVEV